MIRHARHSRTFHVMLGAVFLLAACESTPTNPTVQPNPVVTGVTIAAPATTIPVGTTTQLTATVNPSTVSQSVTWSSSDVTRATVSNVGLVTSVFPGTARITAASVQDPTKVATVDVTLTGCVPLVAADVLNGGTLLADVCYQAQVPLTVNSGTLTMQPGVRVEFGTNGSLTVATNGRLRAVGTAAKPIVMTSIGASAAWRGLRFADSRGPENMLHYVTIANGGSAGWSGATQSRSGLLLESASLVDIQNSTITGSGGQGITLYSGAEMTFINNTLSNNAVAAWTHPNSAQYFDGSTAFTANTANVVRVTFGNTDVITTAQTWRRLNVPYEIQSRTFIDAKLTLAPGVVVSANPGVSLVERPGGAITAVGTNEGRITFTSTVKLPNSWIGIQITTATPDNKFDYVIFENGGSQAWTGASDSRAMVYLDGNSKAVFTNSTFRGSGHYGLWVPAGGDIAGFSGNLFTDNARAMIVHPDRVGAIAANNTFTSNTENKVRVTFGNSDRVNTAQTWQNTGTPFYVMDRTFVEAALTISAGTVLEFAQNASLRVANGGSLRGNGTTGVPIIFRGAEDLVGYWQGIQYDTFSANNVLTFVTFSNAGAQPWFGGANSTATLHITSDGLLNMSNVSFSKTGGYAAIVRSGGSLSCTNVSLGGFMNYVHTNSGGSATLACAP